jgi:hypothetical protein
LQLLYKQKYHDWVRKTGKNPSPKDRRELKDQLKAELMTKALPQVAHVDAFWRDRRGELLLFSTGKKVKTTFESLFTSAFAGALGFSLMRIEPPLLGLPREHWNDSQVASETLGRLSLTTPVVFAEQIYP